LLQTLQLVQLGDALLDAAGMLDPEKMRSLDATTSPPPLSSRGS
jgi:hypothetical protein